MTAMQAAIEAQEMLGALLGQRLLGVERPHPDTLRVDIARDGVRTATEALVRSLGARFMVTIATDLRPGQSGYGISHVFSLDPQHLYVVLDCRIPADDPCVESITPVVPGAAWAEREAYDLLGVRFDGHPDPRRLVVADDWPEGVFPMRRDFAYNEKVPPAEGVRPPLADPPAGASVLPLGPFFPVLEEPSYWRLFVDGETVVGCDYRGFYNHRAIEKLGDSHLTYNEIPYVAERICGICGFIHSSCYCQAVEQAAGIEPPRRARYIRTIMLELERVHSHLLWLGIAGHILGFDTFLMQAWRIREPVMWLSEAISGNRKTYGMNTIGGLRRDLPKTLEPRVLEVLGAVEKEVLAVQKAIVDDTTLLARTRGVGVLTNKWAREMCVVGPPARSSGVRIDARIDHPYAAYDEIPPRLIADEGADIWARVVVRVGEALDSVRIMREALAAMPAGPVCAEISEEIPPGRLGISVVEAPRGEAIHVVLTGGDNRPSRWRVRAPSYPNLQAAPEMMRQDTIADVPIIIGSLDPCFSCTERVEAVDVKTKQIRVYTGDELSRMSRRASRPGERPWPRR